MLKCFEGENTSMCEAIRQMIDEGIMLGEKRGEMQKALAIARRMLEMGYSEELVIDATMLTKQEVEELSRTIKQKFSAGKVKNILQGVYRRANAFFYIHAKGGETQ